MKILLLNQTFYPDIASTAQHLSELAAALSERGHEVTVVTSRRAYDDPGRHFPGFEKWRGIRIIRVGSAGFGKGAKWRRAADFGSFLINSAIRLAFVPKQDVVVALTSPPLISFLGAWLVKLRGGKFVYWVMDFNPDEAIAAGWLRADSISARMLDRLSRFSLRKASKIIALDRFMRERIALKKIAPEKIIVLPPWSHDSDVRFDPEGREKFRREHGLQEKFVVMYSGNHSPCHPLDTLLRAAEELKDDARFAFCFIGGGSEFAKVKALAERSEAADGPQAKILCLPYQPLGQLASSLSAADLHLVVMGEPFVGLVHPCKIYNILGVGAPVLYLGPSPSHVTEIAGAAGGGLKFFPARHGDVKNLMAQIRQACEQCRFSDQRVIPEIRSQFSKQTVLPKLIAELESV